MGLDEPSRILSRPPGGNLGTNCPAGCPIFRLERATGESALL